MKSRGAMRTADMDGRAYAELGKLMRENPRWTEEFPDLHKELNPIRFTKNRVNAPKAENVRVSRHVGEPSLTDYQATYTDKRKHRPRSSKRPPPSPRYTRPPPMVTKSVQQDHYTSKFEGFEGRPPLTKKEEEYVPPTVKFEAQSKYTIDYPAKSIPAEDQCGPIIRPDRRQPAGRFDDRTTNKETFKSWKEPRQLGYSELPSFTGSILYPDQSRNLQTTTGTTYQGASAPKPDAIRMSSPNIKIEGERDFNTIHRNTYKHHGQVRPASMIINKPELMTQAKSKFDSRTMNSTDYGFKDKRPPKACVPAQPTIDLKFNNKTSFTTEQRQQYQGIDVRSAPVVASYKPDVGAYKPPTEKFETQTKHQLDYKPLDVMATYQPPVKPPHTKKTRNLPKFVGTTTSEEFFRRWETVPRHRYGDIHEAMQFVRSDAFVPKYEKMNTQSTAQDSYKGKTQAIREPFYPEAKGIDKSGAHDFSTMYRNTYDGPQMEKNLSKSQAAKLLNELRKRDTIKISSAPHMGNKVMAAHC